MTVQLLPVPADRVREAYLQLIADIDMMMEKNISMHFQDVMKCGPGCSDCCVSFSVLPLEAAFIAQKLSMAHPVKGKNLTKCLLLSDDLCQVYAIRPVICRTQGLPLGYVDEFAGTIEVSACPLNFPEDFPFTQENLFFMDQFNLRLAELNAEYCEDSGVDPDKRIPLGDLIV